MTTPPGFVPIIQRSLTAQVSAHRHVRAVPLEYPSQRLQVGLAEASPAPRALTANSHRTTAAPLLKCLIAHRLSCSSRLD